MAKEKLYAGAKLRSFRRRLDLTQREFAGKLDISLPYLNQMENNNRPLSGAVILGLAQVFGFDVTELASGDTTRLVHDMREALADPVFGNDMPNLADLRMTANNAPDLARAFLQLHQAYRQSNERLASLDDALGRADPGQQSSPWEDVRDFFHYCDNYIDAVDHAAEKLATTAQGPAPHWISDALAAKGIHVVIKPTPDLRVFDPASKALALSSYQPLSQ